MNLSSNLLRGGISSAPSWGALPGRTAAADQRSVSGRSRDAERLLNVRGTGGGGNCRRATATNLNGCALGPGESVSARFPQDLEIGLVSARNERERRGNIAFDWMRFGSLRRDAAAPHGQPVRCPRGGLRLQPGLVSQRTQAAFDVTAKSARALIL